MTDHPILFTGDMVQAILDGKTQTRRIIKPQPENGNSYFMYGDKKDLKLLENIGIKCPYGSPGDRLWVRETWLAYHVPDSHYGICYKESRDGQYEGRFSAALPQAEKYWTGEDKWRPSIHMPKWACRLWLEVISVRVERVQEISEADIKAEGVFQGNDGPKIRQIRFMGLWDSINAKRGYGWASNPWVWVIEFKRSEL